jgi:hypothetical protein
MKTASKQSRIDIWLFNPFTYIAGWQSLLSGVAAILIAGYLGSLSNTHFYSVVKTTTLNPASLWIFMSEGFIDWLSLGIVLLVFGKIISNTQFRTLDLLGTQAMARWPTIITALVYLPNAIGRFNLYISIKLLNPTGETPINFADAAAYFSTILVIILATCWFVALAYRSYTISCNVKGRKAILTFLAGTVIAEILSRIAIYLIFPKVMFGVGIFV